jgi:hypothetical protein
MPMLSQCCPLGPPEFLPEQGNGSIFFGENIPPDKYAEQHDGMSWELSPCIHHPHIHMHMHTYMHAFMHAHMHTYIHANGVSLGFMEAEPSHPSIHPYMHACTHTYIHYIWSLIRFNGSRALTSIHPSILTCIYTYMHTHIHKYMHTCTHTHTIHTYINTHTYIHRHLLKLPFFLV